MQVATVPAYDKAWAHPMVVAALSDGRLTDRGAEPWSPVRQYDEGDQVVYGGYVFVAASPMIGFEPDIGPDGGLIVSSTCGWIYDQDATIDRLRLHTAIKQATWLLDTLTGYRLHGQECWVEDYVPHTCTIRLRRQPVEEVYLVEWVHRCNVLGTEVAGWCRDSVNTVSLCCNGGVGNYGDWNRNEFGQPWMGCGCGRTVRVTYQIASNLPPGTEGLIVWLANEYAKAAAGEKCDLPERMTNVTRQGVSWTVLDPQDFLEAGRTGMARVDTWLMPVKTMLGGQLIDPLTSDRVFSKPCPEINPLGD